jgi:hypothetical protein
MRRISIRVVLGVVCWLGGFFNEAQAGLLEVSGGYSYSQGIYQGFGSTWSRRYSLSVGYFFLEGSEIEFSLQDVLNRTEILNIEDATFHDKIYSIDWVQMFLSKEFFIQPFLRLGLGQLDRAASGSYLGADVTVDHYSTFTTVGGIGVRLEGTSYCVGGDLSTWKDNFAVHGGISLYL